jgi:hypothetical protein
MSCSFIKVAPDFRSVRSNRDSWRFRAGLGDATTTSAAGAGGRRGLVGHVVVEIGLGDRVGLRPRSSSLSSSRSQTHCVDGGLASGRSRFGRGGRVAERGSRRMRGERAAFGCRHLHSLQAHEHFFAEAAVDGDQVGNRGGATATESAFFRRGFFTPRALERAAAIPAPTW